MKGTRFARTSNEAWGHPGPAIQIIRVPTRSASAVIWRIAIVLCCAAGALLLARHL